MKHIIATVLAGFICTVVFGQALEVKDFKIHNTDIDNPLHYQVSFLINDASLADSVYLMFGTGKDQNDLFFARYTISCQDGNCYVNVDGQQHQVIRYKAGFPLVLTEEVKNNATNATLYIYQAGEQTHTLYYRLK